MEYVNINLEDYFQTGEGGTALTYNHKNGKTLAKLFAPGFAAATAEREFLINREIYESGLPTPKPIRLVTDGARYGAEYELIAGKRSFTRIISQEPDKLEPLSQRFAILARQIHQMPADTDKFPDMRELIRDGVLKFDTLRPYIALKVAYSIGKLGYGAKGVSEGMKRLFDSFLG